MVHLESSVATKTFQQVNRTVKSLLAQTGNTVGAQAGWGGTTFTLDSGPPAFSDDYLTINDLILWNPTGDGRANISQIATNGTHSGTPLNEATNYWHFGAGPVLSTFNSASSINSPIHDPDVRALYPDNSVRTNDAKLTVDVNMGGGTATLRAAPFTKDMAGMTPTALRLLLLADRHSTRVVKIGGGAKDKRITFPKWVQSRRAVGEFTSAKIQAITDSETHKSGFGALYTDEFCYGGWIFVFENISPAQLGSTAHIEIASVVDIQVQLSLNENHLREKGAGTSFSNHLRNHETLAGAPGPLKEGPVSGGAVDASIKGPVNPRVPGPRNKFSKVKTFQGPPGHARRGPNMRGSFSAKQQAKMSKSAKKNRTVTMGEIKKQANKMMANRSKNNSMKGGGNGLVDILGALLGSGFGGQAPPSLKSIVQGYRKPR